MGRITVLGCGDAFGSGGRYTTSFLVERNEQVFLIDCGAASLIRLKQLDLDLSRIDQIFITHFHGDHYGGLPFLLLSNKIEFGGTIGLTIYGPPGIKAQLRILQEALYPGTGEVLDELPLDFVEYNQDRQSAQGCYFQALPVTHAPPSNPHGLRFEWTDRAIAFSGDTEWDDHLISLSSGTDLFITECNNQNTESPGHLSLQTLIQKQKLLNSKQIFLSHMGTDMLAAKVNPEVFKKLEDGMEIAF
jgi:ribonuclease BN (tRNA processing enzyme)